MNTSLVIGHLGLLDAIPLLVAVKQGYFAESGLTVELSCELGLSTLCAKFIEQRFAAACVPAPVPVLLAAAASPTPLPMEPPLPLSFQDLSLVHLRRIGEQNRPLRMGLPAQASAARLLTQRWWERQSPAIRTELVFVSLSVWQLPAFFKDGMIDGFCAPDPLPGLAALTRPDTSWVSGAETGPMLPGSVLALPTEVSRSHPELRAALQRVLQRAGAYCNTPANAEAIWSIVLSQPGLRGLKPEQRELVLRRVAAGDPPSAIRYADTHTPADLGARELGMVTDVCRQSLRGGGRGMPIAATVNRLYSSRTMAA